MKLLLSAIKDDETTRQIQTALKGEFTVDSVSSENEIMQCFVRKRYDFMIIELSYLSKSSSVQDYKSAIRPFWQVFPDTDIIVVAESSRIRDAVDAVKAGVSDFLTLPLHVDELRLVINRIENNNKILSELIYLRNRQFETDLPLSISTKSPLMKEVISNVLSVADTDSTVLITGETGTGKGLIAKLIHQRSKRKDNQYIPVHCGAITETLLESELFGHEKGAFTGAIRRKLGKFEIADKGTIFLDEIGTVSPAMQIKLLQVIQDRMFYRVGGEENIQTDVRIIAATNSDLALMSKEEKFRLDLYYRLNVFQIEMPPLRHRLEDLSSLVEQILKKLNRYLGKDIFDIHEEVMQAFREYDWPGNIRELENLLERAYILETTSILTPKSFPIKLFKDKFRKYVNPIDISKRLVDVRKVEIERVEKEYLTQLLSNSKGRIREAALSAGIGERQLNKLMNKYGLQKNQFKKSL